MLEPEPLATSHLKHGHPFSHSQRQIGQKATQGLVSPPELELFRGLQKIPVEPRVSFTIQKNLPLG
jgi:hypothetical protein